MNFLAFRIVNLTSVFTGRIYNKAEVEQTSCWLSMEEGTEGLGVCDNMLTALLLGRPRHSR